MPVQCLFKKIALAVAKMPGNRNERTLKEKVQVLKFLEAVESFRISKTCVNSMEKQQVEYLEQIEYENDKLCRKVIKPATTISVKLLSIGSAK
jgi:hypothetical protein